jgi:nitrous oxidase accessory protein NosD
MGEGVGFDSYYATNHQYVDCEAVQIGGATGSGFGASYAKDIAYSNCRASGSAHWMGFTVFKSEAITYQDCHGALNAQRGLNCESSKSVRYVNCRAGGQAASNRGDGIYVYQSSDVDVIDCVSNSNLNGLLNNGSSVRVIRGDYSDNRSAGLAFVSEADWENTRLDEAPAVSTNGLASILIQGQPQVIEGMS